MLHCKDLDSWLLFLGSILSLPSSVAVVHRSAKHINILAWFIAFIDRENYHRVLSLRPQ